MLVYFTPRDAAEVRNPRSLGTEGDCRYTGLYTVCTINVSLIAGSQNSVAGPDALSFDLGGGGVGGGGVGGGGHSFKGELKRKAQVGLKLCRCFR